MHTGKRQQTRHTRTQLPAGAIVANLASSAHALCALCILLLARQQAASLSSFYFWSNYHQVLRNRDEAGYYLAKVSSSENVTGTPLVALAARRSRRARTTGHQLQVDRLRSLPRRNLGTTGVSKDRGHVKARKERTPGQHEQPASLWEASTPVLLSRTRLAPRRVGTQFIAARSNQRRSSTASNQLTVLHPARDPDSRVTIQWRNSGLLSPPSKADAFSSSSAHQLLGRHFTSNPCRQPGTVERCLQHTVGQRNQPSFSWDRQRNQPSLSWDRQRNQPSLSWDQKWSPLFWKGEVLDMLGTYRLVQ